jgi:demethylmenaquinone methyltransferase/2-methoxy-6-polyprenyl-1,4-benzoquinol methylase
LKSEDLIKQMNDYYAKRAPEHDYFMGYTSNEKMEQLLAPIIEWFDNLVKDRDVLEIACGTGNWTQVLAKRARSVVATDVNPAVLEIALTKRYENERVSFEVADAYGLHTVQGLFSAAFAADWWSHIPYSAVGRFVTGLTAKLRPRSSVIIIDMLPMKELDRMFSHYDAEGNLIHRREFPDGKVFEVVKNFPKEEDLLRVFGGVAENIEYREHDDLRRWVLTLTTK